MAEPIPEIDEPPKRVGWRAVLVPLVPALLAIAWIFVRAVEEYHTLAREGAVTIPRPWVTATLGWTAVGATVTWLILVATVRGLRAVLGLTLFSGLLAWMCAFGSSAGWSGTVADVAVAADGTTWGAVRWSSIVRSRWSVVIVRGTSPVSTHVELVTSSHFGIDGLRAFVVRPGSARPEARVVVTRAGVIASVSGEHCQSAYDVATGTEWTNLDRALHSTPGHSEAARGRPSRPLDSLSPFALLGDGEEGREEDLRAIVDRVAEAARWKAAAGGEPDPLDRDGLLGGTLPPREVLEAELTSPNPWVRSAARRILNAAGPTPPNPEEGR